MFTLFSPVPQRRLECVVLLALSLWLYQDLGFEWRTFVNCFFLPDISILTYFLFGSRIGALSYNMAHCFVFPLLLGSWGYIAELAFVQQLSLIWLCHIAFDRTIGWGLKFQQGFCDTDMGIKLLPIKIKALS